MVTMDVLEQYILHGTDNRLWYEESHASAARWCHQNDADLTTLLNVTAILSPRVQVVRNIRLARQWMRHLANITAIPSGIMNQRLKALSIYHKSGLVSGTKVRAFRDSLMLTPGAVCIDIHMSRLFGYADGDLMKETKVWKKKRNQVQGIVRKLAKRYNVESYQMQAMLWCGYLKIVEDYSRERFRAMDFFVADAE